MGHPSCASAPSIHPSGSRRRIQQLIDDLFETMKEYQGVGLAAPQIHEKLRVFVAGLPARRDAEEAEDEETTNRVSLVAMINRDRAARPRDGLGLGGCLSIPDIRGRVPRARHIVVRAYDRTGKKFEMEAAGFTARVIQHETDHLDGILFFDRMKSFESLTFLDEFGRYWSERPVRAE